MNSANNDNLLPGLRTRNFLMMLTFSKFREDFRLQLQGSIYRPDSFVLMLSYCVNLKAIRYESTSLNRIVADESHRVIVALADSLGEKL